MYNRYVPQGDGSYRRNAMPDPGNQGPKSAPPQPSPPPSESPLGIARFLRQLLPRDFDAEDLLVVLLLLLMSDRQEDPNFPLLTLALYLFL